MDRALAIATATTVPTTIHNHMDEGGPETITTTIPIRIGYRKAVIDERMVLS
jgi:hypothetical protein